MCGEKAESEGHLINGCKNLAQRDIKDDVITWQELTFGHYMGNMAWSEHLIGMIMP